MQRARILATLLVALAIPEVFALLAAAGPEPNALVQLLLHIAYCTAIVIAIWIALRSDGLGFRAIGLKRPTLATIPWGLGLWVFGILVSFILTEPLMKVFGHRELDAGMSDLARMPAWLRALVAVTSGIVEELLYRGFAIERLTKLVRHRWIAGALAAVIFGLAHVPIWGLGFALAADLPMGIYMTAFYLWRRDLPANMFAHSLGLLIAMFTTVPSLAP